MPATELTVAVRQRGEVTVLDILGDLDRDADAPLQRAYDQAVTAGGGKVLLNFSDVGYINSTGIAVIVGLLARARRERRPIGACGLSEHYRHIFAITRLSDFIEMYQDEDSAVDGASAATGDHHGARAARGGRE
jgi:anti-anti-sigma factor